MFGVPFVALTAQLRCHPDNNGVVHITFVEVHQAVSICSTFAHVLFVQPDQSASVPTCLECVDKVRTFRFVTYLE